jgi:hypothetical protein
MLGLPSLNERVALTSEGIMMAGLSTREFDSQGQLPPQERQHLVHR